MQVIVLGNQWVTASAATGHARNKDLLYWVALSFNETTGVPFPLERENENTVEVA
jgi:hypothetical protein